MDDIKKYKVTVIIVVITTLILAALVWNNFNGEMKNFYKAWIDSENEVYYEIYINSKIKMYMTWIIVVAFIVPLEVMGICFIFKSKSKTTFDKKKYMYNIVLTFIVLIFAFMIRNNMPLLELMHYVIALLYCSYIIYWCNKQISSSKISNEIALK